MNNKFTTTETAWCPGCGNFGILSCLSGVLNDLELLTSQVVLVGGIGQAAKTNQYVTTNGFSGLHGRALPAAVGIKLANSSLTVIVNTGDGDSYGEGGNHFLHNIRRNVDITHFVHDNQIYGLTKGQPSPTSDACDAEPRDACNMSVPFNPMLIAIAAGATFVARGFSGNPRHLAKMMKAAIAHNGYALVDILQPCVVFNKVNTYADYKERVYELDEAYDRADKLKALEKSMESCARIPIGILYEQMGESYEDKHPNLFDGVPVIDKTIGKDQIAALVKAFI